MWTQLRAGSDPSPSCGSHEKNRVGSTKVRNRTRTHREAVSLFAPAEPPTATRTSTTDTLQNHRTFSSPADLNLSETSAEVSKNRSDRHLVQSVTGSLCCRLLPSPCDIRDSVGAGRPVGLRGGALQLLVEALLKGCSRTTVWAEPWVIFN